MARRVEQDEIDQETDLWWRGEQAGQRGRLRGCPAIIAGLAGLLQANERDEQGYGSGGDRDAGKQCALSGPCQGIEQFDHGAWLPDGGSGNDRCAGHDAQQAGLEHNAQGAVVGGAVGGAFPALTEALSKAGKVLYHAGIEPHFAAGREAIKGRAYLDAGGERIDDIATALRNYVPKVEGSEAPAGEAAAAAGSAEF